MKFWQILQMGSIAMYVLVLFSVLSIAAIIERLIYFRRKSQIQREGFMKEISGELNKDNVTQALKICKRTDTPFAGVAAAGLELFNHPEKIISNAMERRIAIETTQLERFTAHSARLTELWARLGSTPGLQSLDEELVGGAWPKDQPETFRSAFYLCSEMIQLMENVYLDLDLEATWDHPDNRGWHAMFTIWAKSPLIRRTWLMTSNIYGVRFRYFCARHLDLQTGPTSSDKLPASGA